MASLIEISVRDTVKAIFESDNGMDSINVFPEKIMTFFSQLANDNKKYVKDPYQVMIEKCFCDGLIGLDEHNRRVYSMFKIITNYINVKNTLVFGEYNRYTKTFGSIPSIRDLISDDSDSSPYPMLLTVSDALYKYIGYLKTNDGIKFEDLVDAMEKTNTYTLALKPHVERYIEKCELRDEYDVSLSEIRERLQTYYTKNNRRTIRVMK